MRFGGAPYVFERHQGYTEAMEAAGLDTDGLILWIPDHGYHRPAHDEFTSQLFKFIESKKPSALIAGTRKTTERLAELVTAGQLRVPEDLSIVGFQSTPSLPWIPGRHPTTIALPLREMGTRLASLARRVADGEKGGLELLPCELRPGTSVGPPKRRESKT